MIEVYTDGGARPTNPGPAGWAFVVVHDRELGPIEHFSGGLAESTNNRMELTAVIEAMTWLLADDRKDETITLYSDSQIVTKGINEWLDGWKKNRWRKSNGKPVANDDLWKQIDFNLQFFPFLTVKYVEGHSNDQYNDAADRLATDAALAQT